MTTAGERKCYIALFVCATSRAVHLELVSSMTSEAFLMCLRRFVARRGLPRVIYSDNARTFKKTSKDLEKLFQVFSQEDVSEYLVEKRITWKFILPSSMVGRMVGASSPDDKASTEKGSRQNST